MIRLFRAAVIAVLLVLPAGLKAVEPAAPIQHDADVRLDPESRRLTVSDVISVAGRQEIRFRLASWLTVERLMLDGRALPVPAGGTVWRTSLPDAGPHQIELHLQGTVPLMEPA